MEKQSKFDLFKKHKIEGLQQVVGGFNDTQVISGPDQGKLDAFCGPNEYHHTANWTDQETGAQGDLIIYNMPGNPGNPDPNNPQGWSEPAPNSVLFHNV